MHLFRCTRERFKAEEDLMKACHFQAMTSTPPDTRLLTLLSEISVGVNTERRPWPILPV